MEQQEREKLLNTIEKLNVEVTSLQVRLLHVR